MKRSRITLSVGEIVTDQPGLSRHEFVAALEQAISRQIADRGVNSIGPSVSRASGKANVENGDASLSQRVASATLKAVQQ